MRYHKHRRETGFIIEGLLLLLVLFFAAIFSAASAPAVANDQQKSQQGAAQVDTVKTVTQGARAGDAVLHLAKDADNASNAAPDTDSGGDDGFWDGIGDSLRDLFDGLF